MTIEGVSPKWRVSKNVVFSDFKKPQNMLFASPPPHYNVLQRYFAYFPGVLRGVAKRFFGEASYGPCLPMPPHCNVLQRGSKRRFSLFSGGFRSISPGVVNRCIREAQNMIKTIANRCKPCYTGRHRESKGVI